MNYALAKLIGFALDAIMVLILLDVIGSWVLVMRVRLPDWAYTLLQTVHRAADSFPGADPALHPQHRRAGYLAHHRVGHFEYRSGSSRVAAAVASLRIQTPAASGVWSQFRGAGGISRVRPFE